MADNDAQSQPEAAGIAIEPSVLPDYVTDPDAVCRDEGVEWRFGSAPNYSNTRKVWAEGRQANHATGSLEEIVENLVKNWEVEASFKIRLSDWRTIDHERYSFSMNGEAPQSGEHMLKVGTYNAIITPSEFYCPRHSDFGSSHKTFKRMMKTFAWEVLEVYSGPPKVSFKWRHWGVMTKDYVGFNDKGEKVVAKAHGGTIEIFGVTVAAVNDNIQLQEVETYMDPLQMFRQIAPKGIVNKQPMNLKVGLEEALDADPDVKPTASAVPVEMGPGDEVRESKLEAGTLPTAGSDMEVEQSSNLAAYGQTLPSVGESVEQSSSAKTTENITSLPKCPFVSSERLDFGTGTSQPPENRSFDEAKDHKALAKRNKASNVQAVNEMESAILDLEQAISNIKRAAGHLHGTQGEADTSRVQSLPFVEGQAPLGTQQDVHSPPHDTEKSVEPAAGEAVAAPAGAEETLKTHEEMGKITTQETEMMNTE